jgi:PAS fold
MGLEDPADAIGRTDFDFFGPDHARHAFADEQQLMRSGEPLIAIEERETWEDGHETWVSTTKVPLRDRNGARGRRSLQPRRDRLESHRRGIRHLTGHHP